MNDQLDKPTALNAAFAAQFHTARRRCAYSTETLAALARVDPEVITELKSGAQLTDVRARDRDMDVLGFRMSSHRYLNEPTDPSLHIWG